MNIFTTRKLKIEKYLSYKRLSNTERECNNCVSEACKFSLTCTPNFYQIPALSVKAEPRTLTDNSALDQNHKSIQKFRNQSPGTIKLPFL